MAGYGIDIGAKVEIHSLMDNLVQKGKAVLMISSDLPEVLGMSDVVYVMYHGEIRGKFSHDEATQDQIASVMLGVSAATEATSASVASPGETKAAGTGGAV